MEEIRLFIHTLLPKECCRAGEQLPEMLGLQVTTQECHWLHHLLGHPEPFLGGQNRKPSWEWLGGRGQWRQAGREKGIPSSEGAGWVMCVRVCTCIYTQQCGEHPGDSTSDPVVDAWIWEVLLWQRPARPAVTVDATALCQPLSHTWTAAVSGTCSSAWRG